MEQLMVERSIWIDAPRERVWQAVFEPEQVAQWLLPPALGGQMKRHADGTTCVCMGPMEIPFVLLEAADPPSLLISRDLPDRLLTTTYRLAEERAGTLVTVTLSGFQGLPADARQDRLEPSGAGWEKALENLKAYVGGTELPFPQGYVAALLGYRRAIKETFAVERSIWIAAPSERVWRAITEPTQIERWFSPGTAWTLSALEVGGRLFHANPETGAAMYTQIIERLDPPYRLVMRSVPESSEPVQATDYALREEGGGTRLTITNSGYELAPEESRWTMMEQNAFGFGMMLENIQAVVEGQDLPYPGGF